jgi:hypothetical protein
MHLRLAGVAGLACAVAALVSGCQPADGGTTPAADAVASPAAVATPRAVVGTVPTHRPTAAAHHRPRVSARGVVLVGDGRIVLPNRQRTPGAVNPAVTQQTIRSTICRTGYTSTVRPSSSYTTRLKVEQLSSGYAYRGDRATGDYEEDHLIALEIGGSPSSPRNLWPEPELGSEGAHAKDLVENELHDLVCAGTVPLRVAQRAIATNWWRAYQRYGGRGVPAVFYGAYLKRPAKVSTGGSVTASGDATARCEDGTLSYSQHRSGTCSHHGGVATWINPPSS